MEKHINAYRLKARLVQEVITINPTWGETTQAWQEGYNTALMSVVDRLEEMPAADVLEVRHGRWKYDGEYICSLCGYIEPRRKPRFCGGCGAKMDEVTK